MKTSTITLYYKSLINKDKNFILDNPSNGSSAVESYLATLEKEVITGFQYIYQALAISIKIDKSQDSLNMGLDSRDLNYIKIQNDGETPKYYFIIKKTWKSESTIELVLNMDTLNSFEFNKDYELNKKTFVKREHRDRFEGLQRITFEWPFDDVFGDNEYFYTDLYLVQADVEEIRFKLIYEDNPGQSVIDSVEPYTNADGVKGLRMRVTSMSYNHCVAQVTYTLKAFVKKIDMKSEDISVPLYLQDETLLLEKQGSSNINWCLYYRSENTNEDSPVECFLYPDVPLPIEYSAPSGTISIGDLPANGDWILFVTPYNGDLTFEINSYQFSTRKDSFNNFEWFASMLSFDCIALRKYNGNIQVKKLTYYYDRAWYGYEKFEIRYESTFTSSGSVEIKNPPQYVKVYKSADLPAVKPFFRNRLFNAPNTTLTFSAPVQGTITDVQQIDRTDSRNIKIIDVPYCPSNYELDEYGIYHFQQWYVDTNVLKLVNTSLKFQNNIESNGANILKDYIQPVENVDSLRNRDRYLKDSKLYHSDYYRPKFVYDSFSKTFALEKMEFIKGQIYPNTFNFTFVMTRNIVSKFLFQFEYTWKYAVEDFPNVVAVARNNEEVLYNSAYINYLRTGYNYDLKSKQRQETASGIGIGLNALALVSSIVIGIATENPIAIGGAVASGIGLVGQLTNYAKTTAQNEENIQRKLQETQMQAVSVMNADDIDLLFAYSLNRAKLCYYELSPQMEQILDDLFYYGGYITNQQKIPDVHSRYWFNFVQASLIMEETNNLTEEIENDIKEKFETGVTFLHRRFNTFDFKQEKENIETSIVGG